MCLFIFVAQICGKDNNQYPLRLPLTTFVAVTVMPLFYVVVNNCVSTTNYKD